MLAMAADSRVRQIVLVVPADRVAQVAVSLPDRDLDTRVVAGGANRQASVAAGLAALDPSCNIVLVHDAARPLVPAQMLARVIDAVAAGSPAVIPTLPVTDTIKRVGPDGVVVETLVRDQLRAVQTPQGFRREVLEQAHAAAGPEAATDDASLVEQLGLPVTVVAGDEAAAKITVPADLARIATQLAGGDRS